MRCPSGSHCIEEVLGQTRESLSGRLFGKNGRFLAPHRRRVRRASPWPTETAVLVKKERSGLLLYNARRGSDFRGRQTPEYKPLPFACARRGARIENHNEDHRLMWHFFSTGAT